MASETGKSRQTRHELTDWLPTSVKEMKLRGWDEVDVVQIGRASCRERVFRAV